MRSRHLLASVVVLLVFASALSAGAYAFNQPAVPATVQVARGGSETVFLPFSSSPDNDFATRLQLDIINATPEIAELKSDTLDLLPSGSAQAELVVHIPSGYAGPDRFNFTVRVRETQVSGGGGVVIFVEERDRQVRVEVVSVNQSQTTEAGNADTEAPVPTTEPTTGTAEETAPTADLQQVTEDATRDRVAERMQALEERVRSTILESAREHEFRLNKSSVRGLLVNFRDEVRSPEVSVNTLAIDGQTDAAGLVTTPKQIRLPGDIPAEERDASIVVAGERLPDIEKRVVGDVALNESTRRITSNKAYKYLEIGIVGGDAVDNATIVFEVDKSWFDNVGAGPSDVALNRFVGGEWTELPTGVVGEDAGSYTFSAESGGFSFFVITAAITADITTPIKVELQNPAPSSNQQGGDAINDLFGTPSNDPELSITFSWIIIVIILGAVILIKYKAIKQALFKGGVKADRIKFLEGEIDKFGKIKQETTKKYYKRVMPEDEFKSLMKEYDDNIIRLEAELGQLKGEKKPDEKQPDEKKDEAGQQS